MGARDLAWDYLTTPIGLKPNESEPWLGLARSLAAEGELDLADRGFGRGVPDRADQRRDSV